MKLAYIISFIIIASIKISGQTHNSFHQTLADQISNTQLTNNLSEFVGFGAKEMGTTAQQNTLDWLENLYQTWGYTSIEQQAVSVSGQTGYNLIVTKQGTTYPDTYIVIDAHYDTLNGPGANDNGSGTVVLLELARILQNTPTEYSIKFIHFTGEELGLFGSQQYVQNIVVPQNIDVKLVLNIDQVGGVAGETNNTVTCERDEDFPSSNNNASSIATMELATLMEIYSNLETNISYAYSSDYMPFQEEGYIITGLFEFNESPYTHSPQDTMPNLDMDYITQITKGAMGALCYFAKANEPMSTNDTNTQTVQLYPNPVNENLTIKSSDFGSKQVQISDLNGKALYSESFVGSNFSINMSKIPNGVYFIKLFNEKLISVQKVIVQH